MATNKKKAQEPKLNTHRAGPDDQGFFGLFGGRYVAETLMPLILDLGRAYEEAKADPGHLLMLCLKDEPGRDAVTALQKAIVGREVVRARGRSLYVVYPDGVGRSKLTAVLIERKLGTRGTARNWNTVLKLAALAVL